MGTKGSKQVLSCIMGSKHHLVSSWKPQHVIFGLSKRIKSSNNLVFDQELKGMLEELKRKILKPMMTMFRSYQRTQNWSKNSDYCHYFYVSILFYHIVRIVLVIWLYLLQSESRYGQTRRLWSLDLSHNFCFSIFAYNKAKSLLMYITANFKNIILKWHIHLLNKSL